MRVERLAALTTGLTFVLLVVGVYTKEVGADLACGMNWPLCDGAVFGLFPANLPSAIEWSHRLLALVVGIGIIWTVYRSWMVFGRRSRVTRAGLFAMVLLPVQAGLGALTVLKARVFSTESRILIEALISVSHFATGVLLFTALVAATLWAYEDTKNHPSRPGESRVVGSDD